MAKKRGGGFASGGGFANSGPNRNDPPATAPARGAAARPNRIGRRDNKRNASQQRRQTQRDQRDNPLVNEPAVDQLDTEAGSIAFNDVDNLELGAWGVLNNAGVSRDPGANAFGANQIPWLEDRVGSWVDQHRGNVIVNDKDARFEQMLSDTLAPGTAPPGTAPAGDPLAFKPWLKDTGVKNIKGMNAKKRKRKKGEHAAYTDTFGGGEGPDVDTSAAPLSPVEQQMLRQTLTADWAAATPRTRGYRSSDWVSPKRVVQF